MESNMNTDSGRLYCENVCLNAMSTTSTSILVRGGGGTRPIFGYGWAAEGNPDKKFLKYVACLGRHPQF